MAIIQNNAAERNLLLTLADVPALGVDPSTVVCSYRKEGQSTLTVKPLDSSNFVELGGGYYFIKFTATEMNTLGYFFYTLTSPEFDNFLYDEFTIEPAPGGEVTPTPGICVIHGVVNTASATAARGKKVTARPVAMPTKYESNIICSGSVIAYVDTSGNFELPLVRGATVIIEIEGTGIRVQIVVPDAATAEFIDLVPDFWV
jgi:hypothetical protein